MKVVVTIAGSDSSGGAGIQADLKTFEAFGVFGASVLTVLTAQNTKGVTDISTVEPSFIKAQLEAVFSDFDVDAVKIGMLFSNEIIDTVREFIKDLDIPVVFDPVFISKAGSKLLSDDAIENMRSLLPYATVSTPNQFEAKEMFGYDVDNKSLTDNSTPIIIKTEVKDKQSIDSLFIDGERKDFESPYIDTNATHGTGCSFSSAIAANLALGKSLEEAITISKKFIYEGINNAPGLGGGKGPIAHKKGGELCQ
jgi:hydroxymethylpyrimidine/phosphomethylpyrimidine kinase